MPLHMEDFQRDQLQGYVETLAPKKEYKLARFMPVDTVYDTEFTINIINGKYGQMASVTAWDSGAPLRDKDVLEKMTAELGKVQHGYRLTEKEMLQYNRPRTDAERAKVVESIYGETDKLIWGVDDREEWFRAQAIYKGTLTYSENDVKLANIDFKIPAGNKLTASILWDVANAKPLSDLQLAVKQFEAQNNGESPVVMHFDGAVEAMLLKDATVKENVYGSSTTSKIVKGEDLQNLFSALSLPPYEVIKDTVIGDAGVESLMPARRVVLIGDELGNVMHGPTVENDYNPGKYVVPVIQATNPPKQEVYVGASMFPALNRPKAIVHLTV